MKTTLPPITLSVLCLAAMALPMNALAASPDPYTVVWDSPSADSSGSMPLGNGDVAVNVWVEADGDLIYYISKTDAWSENGRLLKVGRVRVSLDPNPFAAGLPFKQMLDVRTGSILIEAGQGGKRVTLRVWVDANAPVVRIEADAQTRCTMRVRTDPWRTAPRELAKDERFSAYGLVSSPTPVVVEPDTVAKDQGNRVVWYHRNERSIWAHTLQHQHMEHWIPQGKDPLMQRTFGGLIQGTGLVRVSDTELRSGSPAKRHEASVYVLTAQTATEKDWIKQIDALVIADTAAWSNSYGKHVAWWGAFWDRSYIRLSPAAGAKEEEAETLHVINRGYVLQRFISACAGRGHMPIKFNGTLFTVDAHEKEQVFDADYRRWGGPYWFQNTRLVYWPMLASGDHEMMLPLFRMYLQALPFAKERTRTYWKQGGAFFPETMYFWGAYGNDNYGWERPDDLPIGVTVNRYIRYHYDGALELLVLALDYYAFSQDEAFVEETLLPLAEAIPAFFYEKYPPQANGKMKFHPSQALETWQKAIDPAPPIAGLMRVLSDLLALPERLTSDAQRQAWQAIKDAIPPLPRHEIRGKPALAAAAEILEEARNSETPELYAIFPYMLFGVGKPELDIARHTFKRRKVKGNNGWRQDDTQAAILGMAREARRRLSNRMAMKHEGSRFPAFWGPNMDWIPDQDHGGNGLMTLQCMLLQTEGRQITLLPAWPKDWNAEFKLHAPYGTTVQGEVTDGKLSELVVTPASRKTDVVVMDAQ